MDKLTKIVKKRGGYKGGTRKGIPNKLTADIKGMILGALEAKGGQAYFELQADENPVAFMGLVGKVLPMTLAGDPNAPIRFTLDAPWLKQTIQERN